MKLVCPHCSKVIEVDERLAGQTTNCPQCQGPFTVPIAPSSPPVNSSSTFPASTPPSPIPPPPPFPSPPDPLAQTANWGHPEPGGGKREPKPAGRAMGAVGGLLKNFRAVSLPPGVREWLGLGSLVLLFILLFFPWVSISAGSDTLMSQSGGGVAFGGMTPKNPDIHGLFKDLPGAGLLVIYFLVCLVSLFLMIVVLLSKYGEFAALDSIRPTLKRIADFKDTVVMGLLVVAALIMLLYFLGLSFPVENLARGDQAADVMKAGLGLKVRGKIEGIESAEMVYLQWTRRHCWFYLSFLVCIVAAVYATWRWLKDKGYIRRWPKLAIQWSDNGNDGSPSLNFDSP